MTHSLPAFLSNLTTATPRMREDCEAHASIAPTDVGRATAANSCPGVLR